MVAGGPELLHTTRPLRSCSTGHLSALLIFLDRHRTFLFLSPHEAEMLLREANGRGGPRQRPLQGFSFGEGVSETAEPA